MKLAAVDLDKLCFGSRSRALRDTDGEEPTGAYEVELTVPRSAKILLNGVEARMSDLRSGDEVAYATRQDGAVSTVMATR